MKLINQQLDSKAVANASAAIKSLGINLCATAKMLSKVSEALNKIDPKNKK